MSAIGQIEAHRTALNERAGVLAKAQHRPAGIGAEILRGIPGGDGCEPNHSAKETAAITQTGSADRRTAGAQGHADAEQIQAQGIGRGGVEMSEMADRVARAIHAKAYETRGDTGATLGPDWRAVARAAIEAMREPTEAMIAAGWVGLPHEIDPQHPYQQMIDAALEK